MDKLDSIIGPNDNKIIKIFAWNIHGIGNKLETEVIDLLSAYCIIFISETWRKLNPANPKEKSRDQEILEKLDFKTTELCREDSVLARYYKKYHILVLGKPGRGHGDLLVAIRNKIFDKLEVLENHSNSEIVWIRLKKEFISFEGEIVYLCLPYLAPVGSKWAAKQSVDLNARTDVLNDYLSEDEVLTNEWLNSLNFDQEYNTLNQLKLPKRSSQDKGGLSGHGKEILELCKAINLKIVNGKAFQDKNIGKFTFHESRGSSVVDYFFTKAEVHLLLMLKCGICWKTSQCMMFLVNLIIVQLNFRFLPKKTLV